MPLATGVRTTKAKRELLALRLKEGRRRKRDSQVVLARKSRVSNKTIVALERMELDKPRIDVLVRLAYVLDGMDEVKQWLDIVGVHLDSETCQAIVDEIDSDSSSSIAAIKEKVDKLVAPEEIKDDVLAIVWEEFDKPQQIIEDIEKKYEPRFLMLETAVQDFTRRLGQLEDKLTRPATQEGDRS